MAKKDFGVELPETNEVTPFIYRVEEPGTGITWRDAKKACRQWFLTEANKLRSYTEKKFREEEQAFEAKIAAEDAAANQVESVSSLSAQ